MSQSPRVVITDLWTDDLAPERQVLAELAQVDALGAHDEKELVGRVEDAAALMVNHHVVVSAKTIDRLERCKVIVRCGVGFENIDHQHAATRGIPVAHVPDYGTEEVADTAMGMVLTLTRGICFLNSRVRAGQGPWSYTQVVPLQRLRGAVLGLVGYGAIGMAVAARAKAFGMSVLCFDPYIRPGFDKVMGVRRVDRLEGLLGESYVVSLHCGLTRETRHIINAQTLSSMQRGSFLVNTARGALVDTKVIPEAIASGRLAGAALDVVEAEPPSEEDPLLRAWRDPHHPAHHRVILNPHTAFYAEESLHELRTKAAQACRAALLSEPIQNVVNRAP